MDRVHDATMGYSFSGSWGQAHLRKEGDRWLVKPWPRNLAILKE